MTESSTVKLTVTHLIQKSLTFYVNQIFTVFTKARQWTLSSGRLTHSKFSLSTLYDAF
jgi:hypothetical protein